MKTPIIAYVGWLLLLAALGLYVYGIYNAIYLSWGTAKIPANKFPAEISTTISSIQALLLTNLGIALGISIANPGSTLARRLLLNGGTNSLEKAIPSPLDLKDSIQLFAITIFLFSLIACIVTWGKNDFTNDPGDVVMVIPESGKMFIGIVLAYLAVVLRSQTPPQSSPQTK